MKYYYNVPQILQNPELPNGCEITSMCELLNYYGYAADKCDLADNYLPQSKEWYGADPNLVYLGNPRLDGNTPDTGYYCFAGPIIEAAGKFIETHPGSSGNKLWPQDLTGADENDLIDVLRNGHPFVFWASLHFKDIQFDPAPAWTLSDGTVHKPFHMLHCMVCCGVDDEFFYIADPLNYNEKVPRAQFMKIFRQLGSRAVILK